MAYGTKEQIKSLIDLHKTASKHKGKKVNIDLPELKVRVETLKFSVGNFIKDCETQIDEINNLFGLDEKEFKIKLNSVLTNLEYFCNNTVVSAVDGFKRINKTIKRVGKLN